MAEPLLSVRNLSVVFRTEGKRVIAVDDVSFEVAAGEVVGIVGESGSGKSATALAILRLIPSPPGEIAAGRILFEGRDLLQLSPREMRAVRGSKISMIFQEPMTSLNPVLSIAEQLIETIVEHERLPARAAREKAIDMLAKVGIPAPQRRIDDYPHQLSGGMRQRVMIAMALACNPMLLLADEPTTALDVTIQAQILDLLRRLQEEFRMAVILITHNLGVVAEHADRVLVMYAGRVVEAAGIDETFDRPGHPYTEGLLASIPPLDGELDRLRSIRGVVPAPGEMPSGCPFRPRCDYARPPCAEIVPPLIPLDSAQRAACIRHTDYRAPA